MYSALTDLICVAFVFLLAAFLFAVSVAVLVTVEALRFLRRMASAAFAVMSQPLASVLKLGLQFATRKNPAAAFNDGQLQVAIKELQPRVLN